MNREITKEEILAWLEKPERPTRIKASDLNKKELYLCPKSDKCVMECPHKTPHTFDEYCDPGSRVNIEAHGDNACECPECVRELAADITFFEEDFEI